MVGAQCLPVRVRANVNAFGMFMLGITCVVYKMNYNLYFVYSWRIMSAYYVLTGGFTRV